MHPNITCTRIKKIQQQIRQYATLYGRSHESIQLLAVSKTRSNAEIRQAIDCGLTAFGENYAQEMHNKATKMGQQVEEWHFIGPVQSNKTSLICQHASWVHSINRIKIARRFNQHCAENQSRLQICIQVNIDAEPTKSGVMPADLDKLAEQISELDQLDCRGLMIIPGKRAGFDEQRAIFAQCRRLMEKLNQSGHQMDTLSMGMSGDFEAAIAEGATIVRMGTALFGSRISQPKLLTGIS